MAMRVAAGRRDETGVAGRGGPGACARGWAGVAWWLGVGAWAVGRGLVGVSPYRILGSLGRGSGAGGWSPYRGLLG